MDGGDSRVYTVSYDTFERFHVDGGNPRVSTRGEYPILLSNTSEPDAPPLQIPADDNRSLWVYYQNVRGVRTKIDALYCNAIDCNYDVIILIETGLDASINSTQLFGDNFNVFRCDRNANNSTKSSFGGVLIAVNRRFSSSIIDISSGVTLEQICASVVVGMKRLLLCAIYIPPDKSKDVNVMNKHIESVQELCSLSSANDYVLVCGDYNQRDVCWSKCDGEIRPSNCGTLSAASSVLVDAMDFCNLHQMNTERNHLNRTLDLVFISMDMSPEVVRSIVPLLPIDQHHPPLEISLQLLSEVNDVATVGMDPVELDFSKIDFEALTIFLTEANWNVLLDGQSANDMAETFCAFIVNWLCTNVPIRRPTVSPAWSTPLLRRLKRRRNTFQRRLRRNRSYENKRSFHRACNEYRTLNSSLYKSYVLRVQTNLRRKPKNFWNFVNSKRKSTTIPASVFLNDRVSSTCAEKAELFAAHFSSVFAAASPTPSDVNAAISDVPVNLLDLDIFEITPTMVTNAAKRLKCTSSPGPDGIPSAVYCRCAGVLAEPLCRIFNQSFEDSNFPKIWKQSFMVPIHKKGEKRDVKNYRGITNLSAASKLFEMIVSNVVLEQAKRYVSADQHGYMPGRSVATNLLDFCTTCFEQLENGTQVDVIYTDLKAAFDSIDHTILLAKLTKLGTSNRLSSWFHSYLTGRTLQVKVDSCSSSSFTNSSGVPQGSNLGPLLFLLFFNDVLLLLGPGCKLAYADDLKLYFIVRTAEDCIRLQSLLDIFVNWCHRNRLTVSVPKCMVMSFHHTARPIVHDYSVNGVVLKRTESFSDLGVLLDHKLTFNLHRSNVIAKANRQLGFISKISRDFTDPYCLKALYCSLVRPILESAAVVWTPHQLTWSLRLEGVQRKFIRFALRNLPWRDPHNLPAYADRCRLLGLDTLERRRKIQQATFIAKLLNGEVDCSRLLSALNIRVAPRMLRGGSLLQRRFHRTAFGYNQPFTAMVRIFSAVEDLHDFGESSNQFKTRVTNSNLI